MLASQGQREHAIKVECYVSELGDLHSLLQIQGMISECVSECWTGWRVGEYLGLWLLFCEQSRRNSHTVAEARFAESLRSNSTRPRVRAPQRLAPSEHIRWQSCSSGAYFYIAQRPMSRMIAGLQAAPEKWPYSRTLSLTLSSMCVLFMSAYYFPYAVFSTRPKNLSLRAFPNPYAHIWCFLVNRTQQSKNFLNLNKPI